MYNATNTCFLNATIQCLRAVLHNLQLQIPGGECPLAMLLNLPLKQDAFLAGVKANSLWGYLKFKRQHDAHEALRLLLDKDHRLHGSCCKETCAAKVLAGVFDAQLVDELSCTMPGCDWRRKVECPQPVLDLSIELSTAQPLKCAIEDSLVTVLGESERFPCKRCGDLNVPKRAAL